MRKLITALSLLLSTSLFAQLSISSTTPSANDLDVSHSSNITINFSENLNVGTVTPSNIRVVGSIHGEYAVFPLSVMNTMNISPQSNYAKGELITVTISTNVFSTTGNTLNNPYSFSFVVEADDAFYEEGVHVDPHVLKKDLTQLVSLDEIEVVDMDSDNDLDVAFVVSATGIVGWLENNNQTISEWPMHIIDDVTIPHPELLESFDYNADGLPDLIVSHDIITPPNYTLYTNVGGSPMSFTSANIPVPSNWQNATGDIFCADIDGDLDLDFIAHDFSANEMRWFENVPAGTWPNHLIGSGANFTNSFDIDVADIDEDGLPDVIFTGNNALYWVKNPGNTSSGAWQEYVVGSGLTNFEQCIDVEVRDFDDDGDLDIATTAKWPEKVHICENTGSPTNSPWTLHTLVSNNSNFGEPTELKSGDYDGDGDLDLIVANELSQNICILKNPGNLTSPWPDYVVSSGNTYYDDMRDMEVLDMDADSDLDIIISSGISANITWLELPKESSLKVTSTTPISNELSAPLALSNIDLNFNQPINSSTALPMVQGVRSAWPNTVPSITGQTMQLNTSGFNVGEKVRTTVNNSLEGPLAGDTMNQNYFYEFTIESEYSTYDGSFELPVSLIENNPQFTATPFDMVICDIDADGFNDVVTVNYSTTYENIVWHKNPGIASSNWVTYEIGSPANNSPRVYAFNIGDLDNDGDIDVIGRLALQDKLIWFENTGNYTNLWVAHDITSNAAESDYSEPEVVDMDADQDLDIVAGVDGKVVWFENDGSNSGWPMRTLYENPGVAYAQVVAGDIDNDGDVDIVTANYNNEVEWLDHKLQQLENWNVHMIFDAANGVSGVQELELADFDGDNDLDVFIGSFNGDEIFLLKNEGAQKGGDWDDDIIGSVTLNGPQLFEVGDFDGDGDPDLIVPSQFNDELHWYENDPAVTLSNWNLHILGSGTTHYDFVKVAALGDLDNDNRLDIAVGSISSDEVFWLKNVNNQEIISTVPSANEIAVSQTANIEITFRENPDVLTISSNNITVTGSESGDLTPSTFTTTGTTITIDPITDFRPGERIDVGLNRSITNTNGDTMIHHYSFSFHAEYASNPFNGVNYADDILIGFSPTVLSQPVEMVNGDFDGDGDQDIVVASSGTDQVVLLENNNAATSLWTAHVISSNTTVFNDVNALFASDIDKDGDMDLIVSTIMNDKVIWMINNGNVTSPWSHHILLDQPGSNFQLNNPVDIEVVDIDVDNDYDIIIGNSISDNVIWIENTGTNLTSGQWPMYTLGQGLFNFNGVSNIEIGDLDQDNDMDIACVAAISHKIVWLENEGAEKGLWNAEGLHSDFNLIDQVGDFRIGDVDLDGDLDLAFSSGIGTGKLAWLENDGSYQAWPVHIVGSGGTNFNSVSASHLGDLDGDGDFDLISTSVSNDLVTWSENMGTNFTSTWNAITLAQSTSGNTNLNGVGTAITTDLDNNGDLDILVNSFSSHRVVWLDMIDPCTTNIDSTLMVTACNSYTWVDGNTYTSSTNSPTMLYESYLGCDSTVTLDLTIISATTVDAGSDETICEGVAFDMTNSSTVPSASNAVSYVWSTSGDGIFNNNTSLTPVYNPGPSDNINGTVTLTVVATGTSPCSNESDNVLLTIVDQPIVNAGSDETVCIGSNLDLSFATSAAFATNHTSLTWSTSGDGSFSSNSIIVPIYTPGPNDQANGSVTLTLTAGGNAPCSVTSDDMVLTIVQPPTANAGSDETICSGSLIDFATSSTLPTNSNSSSVSWSSAGDGFFTNPNTIHPLYTPGLNDRANGSVVLTLTSFGLANCSDASDDMVLSITPAPTADAGSNESICEGAVFDLSQSSIAPNATNNNSISWSTNGDGFFNNSNSIQPIYTPGTNDLAVGTVILTLTVTGSSPCAPVSDNATLSIIDAPIVNAGSDESICDGDLFDLSQSNIMASASNQAGLVWSTVGDGSFSNANILSPVYTPGTNDISNGTVILTLTATGNSPCASVSDNLTLTIDSTAASAEIEIACDQYIWPVNGNTYTASGVYTEVLTLANGCDDVRTLDLTINNSSTSTDTQVSCDQFTWNENGTTYTANNQSDFVVGTNTLGCPDTTFLDLTIHLSDSLNDVITACDTFTWIDGNTYNASNNSSSVNFTNQDGCDSTLYLDLTLNYSTAETLTVNSCLNFTWAPTGNSFNVSGTYVDTITNTAGCDSIVTIDLTIDTVDLQVDEAQGSLTANASPADYQWLDCNSNFTAINGATSATFFPSVSGDYAVQITQNNCIDTSACYELTGVGVESIAVSNGLVIYPNPTRNLVIVSLLKNNQTEATFILRDLLGKSLRSKQSTTGAVTFNLQDLAPGTYFLEVIHKNERYIGKVIRH